MTIEQAIYTLKLLTIMDAPGLKEAVDMAVSALLAQQSSVKLSRILWEECPTYSKTIKQLGLNMAPGRLQELAQAEKDGQLVELPPNAPLTLEELREMDGEPVFCVSAARPEDTAWGIVCIRGMNPYVKTMKGGCSTFFYLTSYSSAWLAYHRKPKEGTT